MTPSSKQRLFLVLFLVTGVIASVTFALKAFQNNMLFFFSPSQVYAGEAPESRVFRLGGMVVEESIKREAGSLTVSFIVTDYANSIPVLYTGVLPDLFAEGQGVVARGQLSDDLFIAAEVLAKHDENYMPPEVAEALRISREAQK